LVPNIDQMYKEMKKIVEVGNKHGNGDEFPDLADLFNFFGIKNVRVGRPTGNTQIFFLGLTSITFLFYTTLVKYSLIYGFVLIDTNCYFYRFIMLLLIIQIK